MNALLITDLQNDFLPGGSLPVSGGEEIVPLVNEIVHYPFDLIVAVKDWHSSDHGSFVNNHEGKSVGDQINLGGLNQILWPSHCVQGTRGSEFAAGWDLTEVDKIFYKGINPLIDSYSGFFDNGHRQSTGLDVYLTDKGIKKIFIVGFALEYCVKYSAFDALQLGFEVYVIVDVCRGLNLVFAEVQQALLQMQKGGAILISIKDLKGLLEDEKKYNHRLL